jgi:hypothetical protein
MPIQEPLSLPYQSTEDLHVSRPSTYYGETDRPASENEDEALLRNDNVPSPGTVERGGSDDEDPPVGKVSLNFSLPVAYCSRDCRFCPTSLAS